MVQIQNENMYYGRFAEYVLWYVCRGYLQIWEYGVGAIRRRNPNHFLHQRYDNAAATLLCYWNEHGGPMDIETFASLWQKLQILWANLFLYYISNNLNVVSTFVSGAAALCEAPEASERVFTETDPYSSTFWCMPAKCAWLKTPKTCLMKTVLHARKPRVRLVLLKIKLLLKRLEFTKLLIPSIKFWIQFYRFL